jgi:hypothetical protein
VDERRREGSKGMILSEPTYITDEEQRDTGLVLDRCKVKIDCDVGQLCRRDILTVKVVLRGGRSSEKRR